ncbi:MAG: methyltransferase domain-containing protein [Acidobacteriota bacterium]|nr:methyltransferase domain-containing protein [Acidobacteriota bacterium]
MITSRRVIVPELLDHAPAHEAEASLRDLVWINRYLGGYQIMRKVFRDLVRRDQPFTVLDVGAASGDMGAALRREFPRAIVTSLDARDLHLHRAAYPKLVGDAFRLPFARQRFDYVFSSLFLHHFPDDDVVRLFQQFGAVSRRAVVAIDLDRGPLGYHFVPATRWLLGWHPITVHDAPASVQAAFRHSELAELARRAGLQKPRVRVHRPWSRLSLIAEPAPY